jgi:N-methylhydantoinase A
MGYRLGVDVGGTFTDLLLINDGTGALTRVKTPSTPDDPSVGVLTGMRRICDEAGITPHEISAVMHGTTVATNAVLEQKGARVGLITTQGFREVLHIARSHTPGPLAGWITMIKPPPPARLADTREVPERMSAQGDVVRPLDTARAEDVIHELVASGVESLTVSLINAFANPAHEREIGALIGRLYPDFPVTLSADLLPEIREYERTLTACMNSYVRPRVSSYVANLQTGVNDLGVPADLRILRSDAGLMSGPEARATPIQGVLSGPSGGVAGALFVAQRAGFDDILTFDMGGTSTDVALCQAGRPTIARETDIGLMRLKVPSVNVHTAGAGGGSLAHVPEITGALRVGPQSAAAVPGPAAYGHGGVEPTVTDANVVVGYLPTRLLGGEMALDVDAARTAVASIAEKLGLSIEDAAKGILDIVNESMAGALRLVSVERGHDPRDFALFAFGGAGPAHANAVGELMGSFPVVVPPGPGLLCALGDLVADYREEFARTMIRRLGDTSGEELGAILGELGSQAVAWMDREAIPDERRILTFNVDMRYYRQGYEVPIEISPDQLAAKGIGGLERRFHDLHRQLYGFSLEGSAACEIVNLRVIGLGQTSPPQMAPLPLGPEDAQAATIGTQPAYFAGSWQAATIYDRERLQPGNRVLGPAVVCEFDSTTLVLPGYAAAVDAYLNLVIQPEA